MYWVAFVVTIGMLNISCQNEDPDTGSSNVEALIKTLKITNGGLSGGEIYTGSVDNTSKHVTFDNVAAETNIAAIKFDASLSLGATLDKEVYDFTVGSSSDATQLIQTVIVSNAGVENSYQVVINLKPAEKAPLLDKLIMQDASGATYKATVYEEEKMICFGMPEASEASVNEILLTPLRASYTFTTMQDGIISSSNPGKLVMSFMGLTNEYELSFANGPKGGVDFTKAVVHDFSVRTNNCPDYFAGELVRGSDFDGEHVLIVSRTAEAATPRLLKTSDLLADNANNPIMLNVTGIEGGVHMVSAGRLSHGHIYICNLQTGIGTESPLKIYHYSNANAAPEVVLTWDGYINDTLTYTGRLGDNISINLDENGNGYAFLCKQEPGDKIYRWTISNFNKFSDPYEISLPDICSYYGYVNEVENGKYLFTSAYVPFIRLIDANGNILKEVEFDWTIGDARPNHGVDPRIIEFNRSRWLMFTVSNSQPMHWNFGPVFYMMDITEGFDVQSALVKLEEKLAIGLADEENPWEPDYTYFIDETGTTQASACSAQCNAAEVNGKLVVYTAAVNAGFALIEIPRAE